MPRTRTSVVVQSVHPDYRFVVPLVIARPLAAHPIDPVRVLDEEFGIAAEVVLRVGREVEVDRRGGRRREERRTGSRSRSSRRRHGPKRRGRMMVVDV